MSRVRTDIPALSLREPWAWAILHLGKTIENRTWSTRYRGRILLHAAQKWDQDGSDWLLENGCEHPTKRCFELASALGAYVGEVTVVDCCRFSPCLGHEHEHWPFGPVCWILAQPVAYPEPIPGRGYPGLYRTDTGRQWPVVRLDRSDGARRR